MFTFLVTQSLRNRVLVLAIAFIMMVHGAFTALRLPIDVFPDLNRPTVTIMTEAEGLAPPEVEKLVSYPIETQMNGLPGVERVGTGSWHHLIPAHKTRSAMQQHPNTVSLHAPLQAIRRHQHGTHTPRPSAAGQLDLRHDRRLCGCQGREQPRQKARLSCRLGQRRHHRISHPPPPARLRGAGP